MWQQKPQWLPPVKSRCRLNTTEVSVHAASCPHVPACVNFVAEPLCLFCERDFGAIEEAGAASGVQFIILRREITNWFHREICCCCVSVSLRTDSLPLHFLRCSVDHGSCFSWIWLICHMMSLEEFWSCVGVLVHVFFFLRFLLRSGTLVHCYLLFCEISRLAPMTWMYAFSTCASPVIFYLILPFLTGAGEENPTCPHTHSLRRAHIG